MPDIAPISELDATETEDLLAANYPRNSLMGTLSDALRKVVDTNRGVFYAGALTESQVNNLRTTMQRIGMRISAKQVRRAGVPGHLITATTYRVEDAD